MVAKGKDKMDLCFIGKVLGNKLTNRDHLEGS